jgi:predicted CopG family antitoxin
MSVNGKRRYDISVNEKVWDTLWEIKRRKKYKRLSDVIEELLRNAGYSV